MSDYILSVPILMPSISSLDNYFFSAAPTAGIEPRIIRSRVRRLNHSATGHTLLMQVPLNVDYNYHHKYVPASTVHTIAT